MLVIPYERVIELRRAEDLTVKLNVAEIHGIFGGLVQPSSTPQKLILIARVITVVGAHKLLQSDAVRASVLIGKRKHLEQEAKPEAERREI